jgi:alpha-tubulin suppressor-like RCC1 family protein
MRLCVPRRGGRQRPPARVPAAAVLRRLAAGGAVVAAASAAFLPTAARAAASPGGTLLAWGDGANGQLGNGTTTDRLLPAGVKLPAGTTVTQVRAGRFHSLALTSTGRVWAWGLNNLGQLGNGTTTDATTPVKVKLPVGVNVTAVRAGCFHSLALTSTGRVLAWGANQDGELGDGTTTNRDVPVPVPLPAGTTVKAISAGEGHSLALTSTGHMLAWGFNNQGELALTGSGRILAWGLGDNGRLGFGGTGSRDVPVRARLPVGRVATSVGAGPTAPVSFAMVRKAAS